MVISTAVTGSPDQECSQRREGFTSQSGPDRTGNKTNEGVPLGMNRGGHERTSDHVGGILAWKSFFSGRCPSE